MHITGLERSVKGEDISSCASSQSPKAEPTSTSFCRAAMAALSLVLAILGLCLTLTLGFSYLNAKKTWAIVLCSAFGLQLILSLMVLERQPKNDATFPFMVPGCPYVPTLSLFINILLLVKLSYWTYVRFAVWLAIGE